MSTSVKKSFRDGISSEVARILREERLQRGFSMNLVSERAGLSRPMISLVERELRKPTLDTLLRMTEAMEIDLVEVLKRAMQTVKKSPR